MKIGTKIAFTTVIFLLCMACVKKRDLSQNTLIMHFLAEPLGLHPTNDNNAYQRIIFSLTQKRLIQTDIRNLEVIPDLIEEMPQMSADSLTYHFKLKPNIKWDDGSSCTAQDVAFSLKLVKCSFTNNPSTKPVFDNIAAIDLNDEDPLKFSITIKQLYFNNIRMFIDLFIIQEKLWDSEFVLRKYSLNEISSKLIADQHSKLAELLKKFNHVDNARVPSKLQGLGPYKVIEWSTGNNITLEKKQNWWGSNSESVYDKQYPDKIIFKIIKDMEPTVLALKKEQIDFTTELTTPALIKLKKRDYFNEHYHAEFLGSYVYAYMGLNMRPSTDRKPYFVDKRVRRAIAHLTPVEEIIEVLSKGKANRMTSFVLPVQDDYNNQLELIDLNIEKARALLDEAGWKDTDGDNVRDKIINGEKVQFSFTLNYMISPVTKDIALMIKESMYKAGIALIPNPMDFSVFYQKAFNQEFDAMLGSWSSNAGPEDPKQIWHTNSWETKGANFVGFGNSKSDSLIDKANITLDKEKRKAIMFQLQEMVYDEQPYVFIYNATKKIAIHKRFDNIDLYTEKPHVIINNLRLNTSYTHLPSNF